MSASVPYIIIVCVFSVFAFFTRKESGKARLVFNILCSSVFLIFFGLRGDVGNDYAGYCARFYDFEWSNVGDFFLHPGSATAMEPGFIFSVIFCRHICSDYHFFVFLCTALTYFLTYRYLSANVRNIPFALVIFICMGGIQLHIDFVRSAVSAALFMYSIRYIEERKLKQFLLLNLVGLTFHVSALLYIPVYFLYGARISNKLLAGIGIAGALLQFLNIPLASYICIFIDKVFWGIDNVPFDLHEFSILPTIPIGAIERLTTGSLLLFFHWRTAFWRNSDHHRFYLALFFLYYFLSAFLWDFPIIAMRLSLMFSFVYCIIWTALLDILPKRWEKGVFLTVIGLYMFLRLVTMTSADVFRYESVVQYWLHGLSWLLSYFPEP